MRSLRLYCLVPTLHLVAHTYLAPILSSISLRLLPPGPFDQLHSNSHSLAYCCLLHMLCMLFGTICYRIPGSVNLSF